MKAMKTRIIKSSARVLGTVAVVVFLAWFLIAQPSCRHNHTSATRADSVKLRGHVEALSQQFFPRDWQHRDNLDRCSDYIAQHFRQAGAAVEFQTFASCTRAGLTSLVWWDVGIREIGSRP